MRRYSGELELFDRLFRNEGFNLIAGVDEAGRGPLAGPVVAAAVILPEGAIFDGARDSKKLSPEKRESLFQEILSLSLSVGVGYVLPWDIDKMNILKASLKAMEKAICALKICPDLVLIDGPYRLSLPYPQVGIPRGDTKSLSIAIASIVAKVFRDRLMCCYHRLYPDYGFDRHKGYPTKGHLEALANLGPSPIHRRSFRGVYTSPPYESYQS
ncbi:MAG: ribonuclease HII [Syntrophobacterales bacterium]|nr:ribonuclease HII [Syntrophobacterales bacterium]